MKRPEENNAGVSRRSFITATATAAAAFTIVPRHVLGGPGYTAPSDKLNIGCVGIGGKGHSDSKDMESENVIALCDVDEVQAAGDREKKDSPFDWYPNAKFYKDFRVMLDKEKDLDAITVSTPDHTHAIIALEAMQRGKHVYVQKPLTHTIHEARVLREAAKKYGVISQMGTQGHAGEGGRLVNEWLWDGAIGDVTEAHCWTNRPIWPQNVDAPTEMPSVPPTLDWNLWLGPMAWRPYHPAYVPFSWRGYWDFGTGALGDMGAHIIDHAYWALKLKYPTTVQASSSAFTKDSPPNASIITYEFPERDGMSPVTLTWYDGGLMPPRPEIIEQGRRMGDGGGGVLLVGSKGSIMCSTYGTNPRILPETKMKDYQRDLKAKGSPKVTIPRSPGIAAEWIQAIKEGKKELATTNFEYSGPLTETMLLGNVAIRMAEKSMKLDWDGNAGKFTNLDEANELLHVQYRDGWSL